MKEFYSFGITGIVGLFSMYEVPSLTHTPSLIAALFSILLISDFILVCTLAVTE